MGQPRGPWQAASPAIPFVPDAIPFVPDEAPVPEGPGKIVEAGHYVSRWQLWSVVGSFVFFVAEPSHQEREAQQMVSI
jgi:hypothetical protein